MIFPWFRGVIWTIQVVSDFRFRHRKCHFWSFPFKYADKCDNFVVEYFSGCVVHFQVIWGLGLTRNLFRNVSTMWDILQKERTPSATKIHCLHLSSISMISKLKAKTCVNILWSQLTRKVLPSPPLCPASCLGERLQTCWQETLPCQQKHS